MKLYIKSIALVALLLAMVQKGMAQCFPNLPVTSTYADPATSASPNANRVFWLTWGSSHAESMGAFPYGKPDVQLKVGSKTYGSIPLGGGRFMCVEAEITVLRVSGITASRQKIVSYIPGTYQGSGQEGDFLDILYNIGGSGVTNGKPNNRMASGIINDYNQGRTVNIVVKVKATTDGKPVRIRGMVLADAEALGPTGERIVASGDGSWTVARVQKNVGQGDYMMRKENNTSGTKSILFEKGNNKRTGAVAFLKYNSSAYASETEGYAVEFSAEFTGRGKTAIAFGLLTSGYDFGDAPESYGRPIHLIDDIFFAPDGVIENGPAVNINTTAYNPGALTGEKRRYLGSTAPDADFDPLFSMDALGDDHSGTAGNTEEDAWPLQFRRFAAEDYYKPGDKITVNIPYKMGVAGDKVSGWIDFNLNGTFDEHERVTANVPTSGNGNVQLQWTVPQTRKAYSTYVRLRYFGAIDDATKSTGTALYGEIEDHRIYILTPAAINPMLQNHSK